MKRIPYSVGIKALVPCVLIGSLLWMAYAATRQSNLDHALIQAIKAEDDPKILEALGQGASAEARDTEKELTVRRILLQMFDRIQHPGSLDPQEHPPALLLLYSSIIKKMGVRAYLDPNPGPSVKVVQALLDHGARLDDQDIFGATPLWYASRFSNVDTVRLLLDRGANIEARNTDTGGTPLMGASAGVTRVLLDHRANIEAVNHWKETALMNAAENANRAVVLMLLEHGGKVEAKDINGETALDYLNSSRQGTSEDRRKVAELLRRYGAK